MNEIRVETAIGTLVAKPCGDVSYPGIEICLIRNGKESCHSMRMEVDSMPILNNDEPVLNMIYWDGWDEPSAIRRIREEEIDKKMEEME